MRARKAVRLSGFDYASDGLYLVTVCTHRRQCVLGQITGEAMVTTYLGAIVTRQIELLPARLPGVRIDASVVMPNHVHVIVELDGTRARQASPLRVVVGAFKSGSTREINALRGTPGARAWQRGYHDPVIRDDTDLQRVREYIDSNPIPVGTRPGEPGANIVGARLASPSVASP
jgi:putative transposase